jgi:transcriptional regulatory protein LEU3
LLQCFTDDFSVSTGNGQPSITLYNSTLEFDTDDENDMRILPPTLFVRLRQERAADRIGRQLYSTHRDRSDEEWIVYLNMQVERLKADRKPVDGVDTGMLSDALVRNVTNFV